MIQDWLHLSLPSPECYLMITYDCPGGGLNSHLPMHPCRMWTRGPRIVDRISFRRHCQCGGGSEMMDVVSFQAKYRSRQVTNFEYICPLFGQRILPSFEKRLRPQLNESMHPRRIRTWRPEAIIPFQNQYRCRDDRVRVLGRNAVLFSRQRIVRDRPPVKWICSVLGKRTFIKI